jgi:uncharacterized protein (TIRG00374 family)
MRETLPNSVQADRDESLKLSLRQRFFTPQTAISFGIAFALIWFVFARLDIDLQSLWTQVRAANPGWLILAYVAFYASLPIRAIRWRILLRNADNPDDSIRDHLPNTTGLTEIVTLSWFANCVVPAKLGDAYRAYLLRNAAGGSFSRTFGTILAERALDLATVVGLLGLAIALSWSQTEGRGSLGFIQAGAFMLLLTVGFLVRLRFLAPTLTGFVPTRFQAPFNRLIEGVLGSWGQLLY